MTRFFSTILGVLCCAFASADNFGYPVPMTLHASGNAYVTARFEAGNSSELLVDTGSGFVALSRKTFAPLRDLPSTVFVRHLNAQLASGRTQRLSLYRIASLTLGSQCVIRDIEVAVLPGQTSDILGLSALRKVQPFALDLESPSLLLSQCSE